MENKLFKEHIVDGDEVEHCWCEPEVEHVYDDDTGEFLGRIIVHRDLH